MLESLFMLCLFVLVLMSLLAAGCMVYALAMFCGVIK